MEKFNVKGESDGFQINGNEFELLNESVLLKEVYSTVYIRVEPLVKHFIKLYSESLISKKKINELESSLQNVRKMESTWILKGLPKQLSILKILAKNNYPTCLSDISVFVYSEPENNNRYKSRSKTNLIKIIEQLQELGYIIKISHGHYKISEKGTQLVNFIDTNIRTSSRLT